MSYRCIFLGTIGFGCFGVVSHAHSWLACSDYRGDVNYFEHDKCVAWPRDYRPKQRANGYHIADAEARAWANGGCDRPMSEPDWRTNYSPDYSYAIYEPGNVYCLAWPMKNHAQVDLAACANNHAKSDSGRAESLTLHVSSVNPTADPSQAEFNLRNINELAGLARNCSHVWSKPANAGREFTDDCQLGLEKHHTGEVDCKGFQRSPKFCENTGEAVGTGCFRVPVDLSPGHYVGQWHWDAMFPGRGLFSYSSCFDFEVVRVGSSRARPGTPGTTGVADTTTLPCRNNMQSFVNKTSSTKAPTSSTPTPAPPQGSCVSDWEHCATPTSPRRECCTPGYTCVFSSAHWARCQPDAAGTSTTTSTTTTTTPTTVTTSQGACIDPWEHCAQPGWDVPRCCTAGYQCVFANAAWARCEPKPAFIVNKARSKQRFLARDQAMMQAGAQLRKRASIDLVARNEM